MGVFIYAGIDEAGYGPMFGPLTIARVVMGVQGHPHPLQSLAASNQRPPHDPGTNGTDATPSSDGFPDLWAALDDVICRTLTARRGRIAVNDSKKIHSKAAGLAHLERGVLAFASLASIRSATVDRWLDALGETTHRLPTLPPWYADPDQPWAVLPCAQTLDEVAIARAMLQHSARQRGITVLDMGLATVFEDRFNDMVEKTRSKAATSFTFVAGHLLAVWEKFGQQHPIVVVDRQGGRTHYRELLGFTFPDAVVRVVQEQASLSIYELRHGPRTMTIRFQVAAEQDHMPVALASMAAKYTRELLMARFQTWFAQAVPDIKPTAGYGSDAKRFWEELEPHLPTLGLQPRHVRRIS